MQNRWMKAKVYHWLDLPPEFEIEGPAIVEHPETSVSIAASQVARLDDNANISIEVRSQA